MSPEDEAAVRVIFADHQKHWSLDEEKLFLKLFKDGHRQRLKNILAEYAT